METELQKGHIEGPFSDPDRAVQDDNDEWFVFKMYEKSKPAKKEPRTLPPEQLKDACKRHPTTLISCICLEPYCAQMFCSKCKGDHNNHRMFTIEDVGRLFAINFEINAREIQLKKEQLSELETLKENLKRLLSELSSTVEGLVCDSAAVQAQTSTIDRKCMGIMNSYESTLQAIKRKIDTLVSRNQSIEKVKGVSTTEVFKQFLALRHTFNRKPDESERKAIEIVKAFIDKVPELKEMINDDIQSIEFEFIEDIDDKILLSHLSIIDQEFILINRTLRQCTRSVQKIPVKRRYVEAMSGMTLHVFDYKYKEIYQISLRNPYNLQAKSFAYAMVHDKVYFTGGAIQVDNMPVPILYVIDITRSERTDRIDMETARSDHGMVSIMNKYLYVIGGRGEMSALNSVEMYDIAKDKWIPQASLNGSIVNPVVQAFNQHYIYVLPRHEPTVIERFDVCDPEGGWQKIRVENCHSVLTGSFIRGTCQLSANFIHMFTNDVPLIIDVFHPTAYKAAYTSAMRADDESKGVPIKGKAYFLDALYVNYLSLKTKKKGGVKKVKSYPQCSA